MTAPVLDVRGVTKLYGSLVALNQIDLQVRPGGIFGVVGSNGAGKTTLFSVVCGFIGRKAGRVEVCGYPVDTSSPPPPGLLGILPQDARLLPSRPVGAQLQYYGRLLGFGRKRARQETERVLDLVGLGDAFRSKPKALSHGMYKRVGIAQAFLGDPKLIILDEPTAGLDPHAARDIRALLRAIRGDRTVLVSSHNLAEVEDLCHEVAIVHQGRVVRQDSIGHLIGHAAEVAFRFGRVPDDALLGKLRALDFLDDVRWDAGAERVRFYFDPDSIPSSEAARRLVNHLVDQGIPFLEMQLGKSLEDRFVEETAR